MTPAQISALFAAVSAVCPITGVSVGSDSDKTTWRVDFAPTATAAQQTAAATAIINFNLATVVDPPTLNRQDATFQSMISTLRSSTPAQISTFVQNNVTDITTAKTLFAKILLILGTLV